jgi:hypothetical protein
MSLQDDLTAAKALVATLEAKIEAALPHLSVLSEIEAEAAKLEGEAKAAFDALIAKARALF